MKKQSAGILVYRKKGGQPEVFIVHNGGPFWAKKDNGVWSLPKGQIEEDEEPLQAAKREFEEETSFEVPAGEYLPLGEITYPKGGKSIIAWAVEGDFDAERLKSNTFEMQWPPRSGNKQEFPEIDRGGWFSLADATQKLFAANLPFLDRLANHLHVPFGSGHTPKSDDQQHLL